MKTRFTISKFVWLVFVFVLVADWLAIAIIRHSTAQANALKMAQSMITGEDAHPYYSPLPTAADVRVPLWQFILNPMRDSVSCEIHDQTGWAEITFLNSDIK